MKMLLPAIAGLFVIPSLAAQTTGSYQLYGAGCSGSGAARIVLPSAYANKMGENANTFPHARANMRYQQVFLGTEVGGRATWDRLCLRLDERFGGPAQTQRMLVKLGYTAKDHTTLSKTFADNGSGLTTVFDGTLSLPAHSNGGTVHSFAICFKFPTPFVWNPRPGQNLLVEMVNTSASSRSHFEDFTLNANATTSRVVGRQSNATFGDLYKGQGLIMSFGLGQALRLTNTGVPAIGQSFSVNLRDARPSTVAILWIGQRTSIALPGLACEVLVRGTALVVRRTDSFGNSAVAFQIPNVPGFVGLRFANQWLAIDPVNPIGFSLSNGGEGTVGS